MKYKINHIFYTMSTRKLYNMRIHISDFKYIQNLNEKI